MYISLVDLEEPCLKMALTCQRTISLEEDTAVLNHAIVATKVHKDSLTQRKSWRRYLDNPHGDGSKDACYMYEKVDKIPTTKKEHAVPRALKYFNQKCTALRR
ncbi:hypothetical protein LIER_03236 [Lithospermum erythrorhizon]|uniref:Uncharacterized protein n=1 Tax=Lithospermum erythrorhizon TaxID=34254 RepID=A0AAV3NSI5_LITER